MSDVIDRRADVAMLPAWAAVKPVREGRLRALAVASTTRLAALPDVPTFREQGMAGMVVEDWTGVLLPPGVPQIVVAEWQKRLAAALKSPAVAQAIQGTYERTVGLSGDEFESFVAIEAVRWNRVTAEAGIKPE
jgi:tripartite-type tricarboxylate transporter receptor subunit TctC